MARVVRSPRAKQDIVEVLLFTKERWGNAQARAYRDLIRNALEAIAADPESGTQRFTVRPDIWGYHIKRPGQSARHILFYRVASSGTVEIVRMLHDSIDFERHLP
ncbi:MAG: type II toxin-antitoxin system RelE/ParE family toxin [Polyangiaceae bacterium]|nr:type II toxin-antitoxin system RelE/ParE family toxin [Polyangiaceae bacterium]